MIIQLEGVKFMKSYTTIAKGLQYIWVLLMVATVVNAEDVQTIGRAEILPKSQFMAGKEINNEGTIRGDLFAAAKIITSTGIILGDLIAGGRNISVAGKVAGDVLGGAETLDIAGPVGGDIRCLGKTLHIDGKVGKNVNVAARTLWIKNKTQIAGNLLTFCEYVRIDGNVKGYTKIDANRIILNGEFFGDVDINMDFFVDDVNASSPDKKSEPFGTITIMPGTIIHGNLSYKSATRADIQPGAVVKNVQWIESKPVKTDATPSKGTSVWSFGKMLMGTAVYFLIAMLLFKLFPGIFRHQSDPLRHRPWHTTGVGLLGILSILAAIMGIIILAGLSYLLNAVSLSVVTGMLLTGVYTVMFYLSSIPVSLWLGEWMVKDRFTLPAKFAIGLGTLSLLHFSLDLLSNVSPMGGLFGFINGLLVLGVLLLGVGALMKVTAKVLGSIREYEPESVA